MYACDMPAICLRYACDMSGLCLSFKKIIKKTFPGSQALSLGNALYYNYTKSERFFELFFRKSVNSYIYTYNDEVQAHNTK